MKRTVLILGQEGNTLDSIETQMIEENYDVITSTNLSLVESFLKEESIDLILLDECILNIKTKRLIKSLKHNGYNLPIVLVYESYKEKVILEAFDNGIDDCISILHGKKFFLVKIKTLLQRCYRNFDVIRYKDIIFNAKNNHFCINGNVIKLTKLEQSLLLEFLNNSNTLLSRDLLLENVWEESINLNLQTVNVAVKRLKDKINLYIKENYIKSIRGQGYILS